MAATVSAESVIVLDFWPSMFEMRLRIALAEKHVVDYDYRQEDLRNKSDFLPQMNPVLKKIPVLVHNGKSVFDARRKINFSKSEEEKEQAKKDFIGNTLKTLEVQLGDNSYFGAGDKFGYVDVALIPYYSWFYAYEKCGNFKIEPECPKLIEWAKRCLERETVAKTLPDQEKVYEFVLVLRKKFGVDVE